MVNELFKEKPVNQAVFSLTTIEPVNGFVNETDNEIKGVLIPIISSILDIVLDKVVNKIVNENMYL